MSEARLCDICKKPIEERHSFLLDRIFEQYIVKIQYIKERTSIEGHYRRKERLDVCTSCMDKFVEFANEERIRGK